MKKFLYAFLFSFIMVLGTSLFGCSVPTYNIDYGTLNTVVEYNSDFSYLNSGLAIVKQEGRSTYTAQVTKDMVVKFARKVHVDTVYVLEGIGEDE